MRCSGFKARISFMFAGCCWWRSLCGGAEPDDGIAACSPVGDLFRRSPRSPGSPASSLVATPAALSGSGRDNPRSTISSGNTAGTHTLRGDGSLMSEWVRSPGGVVVVAVEGHLGESGSIGVGCVDVHAGRRCAGGEDDLLSVRRPANSSARLPGRSRGEWTVYLRVAAGQWRAAGDGCTGNSCRLCLGHRVVETRGRRSRMAGPGQSPRRSQRRRCAGVTPWLPRPGIGRESMARSSTCIRGLPCGSCAMRRST